MEAFSDSKLVVGQVMGELEARDARMQEYLRRVKRLQSGFESCNLTHVSRSANTHADSLATLATSSAHNLPRIILVKDLVQSNSIRRDPTQIHQVRKSPSWMDPIKNFLKDDTQRENWRPRRYERMLLGSGYQKTTNYIGDSTLGCTYFVYIQKNPSPYLKSYMRGSVEVTPEGGR